MVTRHNHAISRSNPSVTVRSKPSIASTRFQRGLSLVELLVVISVIGFLTAIAMPTIGRISNHSKVTVAKATAKQISQAAIAAAGAGNTEILDALTMDEAIEAVIGGLELQIGNEAGKYQLGSFSVESIENAREYLAWQSNTLIYCPYGVAHKGSEPGTAPPLALARGL